MMKLARLTSTVTAKALTAVTVTIAAAMTILAEM